MVAAPGKSHQVYLGPDVVVKILAAGHSRLDREIALAHHLPTGLAAPLLASGQHGQVRYACYPRVPGTTPGMWLPGVDATTARHLTEQAVERLTMLHKWTPPDDVRHILSEALDHGGFIGQAALFAEIDRVSGHGVLRREVVGGLMAIARGAPPLARTDVPVHADCHWGNWMAHQGTVTALLDFEWARFGEPIDDWYFLARFSGEHMATAVDVITGATGIPHDELRAACEVREAAYLVSDLLVELARSGDPAELVGALHELVIDRVWGKV